MDKHPLIVFREAQKFKEPWVWALMMIAPAVLLYGMIQQLILKKPWGNNPMSDSGLLILGLIVIIGLPLFIYLVRLDTEVRKDGIYYRYLPFHFSYHQIPSSALLSWQVIQYHPLRDYGGWGIRYGKFGKAYTLTGNKGIQLFTKDQKKILLGTLKPEEFKRAIDLITNK
jgi:hypothetical protein